MSRPLLPDDTQAGTPLPCETVPCTIPSRALVLVNLIAHVEGRSEQCTDGLGMSKFPWPAGRAWLPGSLLNQPGRGESRKPSVHG
jgi:hypothetical protein